MKKALKSVVATAGAAGMFLGSAAMVMAEKTSEINIVPQLGYATSFSNLISFVLRAVMAIGALMVFGYLVIGGIEYITSGGEKGKTENARNKITAAIVGLIILAASWALLNLALGFLGLGSLNDALKNVGDINTVGASPKAQ